MFTQPLRIEMQHLVAPCHIGQGIAGMHAAGRHQHQAARHQPYLSAIVAGEDATAGIDGADRKRRVAVWLVAGAAVIGTTRLQMGQGGVAPEIGGGGHGYIRMTSYCS